MALNKISSKMVEYENGETIYDKFGILSGSVSTNTTDINGLKPDVSVLKTDVNGLKNQSTYYRDYIGYGEFKIPSDFIPKLPFSLYRDSDGRMKHTWDLTKTFEQNVDHTYYVDTTIGNDANNGDVGTPFLTLSQALFIANGSAFSKILIIVKGTLWRSAVQADNNRRILTNKQISIIPDSSQESVLIANATNPSTITWTADSGVYKATQTSIYNVIDLSNKDWKGVAKRLTPVSSVSLCTSTVNSYYTDGTSVWVNTFDGRIPDANIVMLKNVSTFTFQLTNSTLYIRGLHMYSGYAAPQGGAYGSGDHGVCDIIGDATSKLVHNKCIFSGGGFGGTNAGVWGDAPSMNGLKAWEMDAVYGFNSVCAYTFRDGFNYHYQSVASADRKKHLVFEFECTGYDNGAQSISYSNYNLHNNNASTVHEGASVIRVGFIGYNSDGPTIADIYGCYDILIDCATRDTAYPSYNYWFTNDAVQNPGKALLINCESGKDGIYTDGLNVFVRNFKCNRLSSQTTIQLL